MTAPAGSSAQSSAHASLGAVLPVRAGAIVPGGLEALAEAGGRGMVLCASEEDLTEEVRAVLGAEVPALICGPFRPGTWAAMVAPQVADWTVVLLPASADGRDLGPRLAGRLARPLLAGALSASPTAVTVPRGFGAELHRFAVSAPVVATLQVGVRGLDPSEAPSASATDLAPAPAASVTVAAAPSEPMRDVTVLEVSEPDLATMDLAEAPRILGGGAGLATAADFDLLHEVAARLGATMGATRVITDRGWVHHDRQIGTTGVMVDPELYLAWGISGAVQHTAGLGRPSHIISINTDPHCPMMQLADLGIVADAPAVLQALAARLGLHAPAGEVA